MAANAPIPSHTVGANARRNGAPGQPRLLEWLNQTIDRLFGFELEADELLGLAGVRKGVENAAALRARAPLTG
ncbi:MAG: hypothetical protein WDO68_08285 [Gammaproteobacteria bacterium]